MLVKHSPMLNHVIFQVIYFSELDSESMDAVIEVCGFAGVIKEGYRCVKPGGTYVLVGLVHPKSALSITAENIIRKCLTLVGTSLSVYECVMLCV